MANLDGVSLNLAAVGPVPSACPAITPAQSSTKPRNIIVAVALVLLVLLFGFWPAFEGAGSPMDEGMILVYPEMLLHGKLPYRDFETFYGPANPAVLAAAFSVFGTDIFVERAVGLLYRILILLAVFAIARHWGNTIGLCCLALTGLLLLGTYLPAYAWIGAIACALWSLWLSSRADSHARCLFGGALAGLALLFRADIGPAMILATLPLFLGMTQSARWKYLLGSGFALLPLAILTVVAGWRPVVDNLFLTPVLHSGPARHLPLSAVDSCILTLVVAHLIAAAVNVVAGIVAVCSKPRDGHARLLLAVALFGLGLTHQTVNRPDSLHLAFVAFISLGILPLSLMLLGSRIRGVLPGRNEALFASITVVAVLQAIAPELTMTVRAAFWEGMHSNADTTFVQRDGRLFPFSSYRAANAVAAHAGGFECSFRARRAALRGPSRSSPHQPQRHLPLPLNAKTHSGDLFSGDESALGQPPWFAPGHRCGERGLARPESCLGSLERAKSLRRVWLQRGQCGRAERFRPRRRVPHFHSLASKNTSHACLSKSPPTGAILASKAAMRRVTCDSRLPDQTDLAGKRLLIFIVAYNAETTIEKVLSRIPSSLQQPGVEVLIIDDSSKDDTFLNGLRYQEAHSAFKITVLRTPENQGYGGNQKLGYRYAIDNNFDIVALLHGDGQYAPEKLPALLAPLIAGEADAVFGSRMIDKAGRARRRNAALQMVRQPDSDRLPKPDARHPALRVPLWLSPLFDQGAGANSLREKHQRLPFRHRNHRAVRAQEPAHHGTAHPDLLRRRDLSREWTKIRVGHLQDDAARAISPSQSAFRPEVRPSRPQENYD